MMLFAVTISFLFAGTALEHKQEMHKFMVQIAAFEKRLDELKEKKSKTPEGAELEEVLNEIADMHKETLGVRQKRETLKAHLRKDHPDLVYSDLSFYKMDLANKKKDTKVDVVIDQKLDSLLKQIQSQYARTLSEEFKVSDQLQTELEVKEALKKQRVKTKLEDKKHYIKDEMGTTIKTD